MDSYKLAKFSIRVIISFAMLGIGSALIFINHPPEDKDKLVMLGISMVSSVGGSWVSMSTSFNKKYREGSVVDEEL